MYFVVNLYSFSNLMIADINQQINWEKVAEDPILSQEISNGHAARMRYSRFKKQIEASNESLAISHSSSSSTTSASRKARKSRIIKSKQRRRESHVKEEALDDEDAAGTSFDSKTSSNSARDIQTPEPEIRGALPVPAGQGIRAQIYGADEALLSHQMQSYAPTTPLTSLSTPTTSHAQYDHFVHKESPSPSPNSRYNYTASLSVPLQQDHAYHSFDSHTSVVGMGSNLFGEMCYENNEYDDWSQHNEYAPAWVSQESAAVLDQRLEDLIDCGKGVECGLDENVNVKHEPRFRGKN